MTEKVYSLIVGTGSYTGNTDSILLALLTGENDNRSGAKAGLKKHVELFGENNKGFWDFGENRETEYGMKPYAIYDDRDGYNSLEIFISSYDVECLPELVALWKEKIGEVVHIETWDGKGTFPIRFKGYKLLTKTITETLDVIET